MQSFLEKQNGKGKTAVPQGGSGKKDSGGDEEIDPEKAKLRGAIESAILKYAIRLMEFLSIMF